MNTILKKKGEKFYNNIIQSMESPNVRSKIGFHVQEWINNLEPILINANKQSLETGLLLLKFTVCVYGICGILS